MKIKTKVGLIILVSLILATGNFLSLFSIKTEIETANDDRTRALEIVEGIFELNILMYDYLLYHDESARLEWQNQHDALAQLFLSEEDTDSKIVTLIDTIHAEHEKSRSVFSDLVVNRRTQATALDDLIALNDIEDQLISELNTASQSMVLNAFQLDQYTQVKINSIQARGFLLASIAFGSLLLLVFIIAFFVIETILKPIVKLREGTKEIADGNLNLKLKIDSEDEIGELKQDFVDMSEQLKASYTSLEKKVRERTKDLEKFRLAVESASDHIVITNSDGIILFANPAAEKITGFTLKEMLGKKAGSKELWGGLMGKEFYKKFWKRIKKDKKSFVGNIFNKRKSGENYVASATISPILDEKKRVDFFVAIERDITKEKEIDKAKTEFVSLASHQLRTPLSAINWYTEMLMNGDTGELNEEQKDYISEIYEGNRRMVVLVNALLNVSRLELGTLLVEPEPLSITELADEAIEELMPFFQKREIAFIKQYDKGIKPMNLDRNLTHMIFQNLLSNAIKYSDKSGTVRLKISKQSRKVKITVSDQGIGIPEAQQDKIFTKLFRTDNAQVRDTEGTGLGLYIVKLVIDRFGGKIEFVSKENKGTTFTIWLPLKGMKK